MSSTLFLFLLCSVCGFVFGELNAFEDPDTLFLLTFQTPIGTFKNGGTIDGWGANGVEGTYSQPNGLSATITHDDHENNPFCWAGLPLYNGGALNFNPAQSEWGMTGNFTLEIWAGAKINTGYTYYESLVFGFPKHTTATKTISAYTRSASVTVLNINATVSSMNEVLEYSAITYNGTHYAAYINGTLSGATLIQRSLTTDISSPLVTIGGKTSAGLTSTYYSGTIYMVRYSGTAKNADYFANNYNAYLSESKPTMTFANRTQNECINLCLEGAYGFGGRKKCRTSYHTALTKTCTLTSFACDWSGIVPSMV